MPHIYYCYKLRREVPLLSDQEWEPIGALLRDYGQTILTCVKLHGWSLDEARLKNPNGQSALAVYETMTGIRLDHPEQLYALPLSQPCPSCSRPFRTPRARMCADCGYQLPEGEVAGPLQEENKLT